ncbi:MULTISPECIES: protein-tyrosine-phosphatase [Flavobacteriaceae]|uniref:protein-tyrosine-phosphatase n=1 Tax=Flavobacteriaceae TaxID=49546 RepID=UPI001490D3C5|nr:MULTISPECIES: protein-tyrosine-phosphatase [Allomuricauda]MDC6366147.1 protein-tyrosine-phosphatase [Muricauda sp. AC10]
MKTNQSILLNKIEETILGLDIQTISTERKESLQPLITYIKDKVLLNQPINLNFICTHNSRRSHLSQVWAQTLANYFGFKNITCYSGGTEATALFPMAAETLQTTGFEISKLSETDNPVYSIKYAENQHPIIGFSKTYDNDFNPKFGFGAIMTCDSANEACPMVMGAENRFPITYKDPKAFDGTPQQAEKYMERSIQIATELFYVFSQVKTSEHDT